MTYRAIGGRRQRSSAWQWSLIGFIPGLFCGVIVMFAVLLEGTLPQYFLPTTEPRVIERQVVMTATEDPNAPTVAPQYIVVTATADPAASGQVVTIAQPTPIQAASNEIVSVQVQPTDVPTDIPAIQAATPAPTDSVPEVLILIRSLSVSIPGGTITMGTSPVEVTEAVNECTRDGGFCEASYAFDSYPAHEVAVDTFLIEITEVTFDQYVAFLNVRGADTHINGCAGFPCIQTQNESPDAPIIYDGANYSIGTGLRPHPVYGVTYYGAMEYCEAIGRRLPTEAEWERAARADDDRIFPWGNRWDNALAKTNRPLDTAPGSFPVGSYPSGASFYGVYDMAGNVAEWVSDWYGERHYEERANQGSATNPTGPVAGQLKVLRGGSWNSMPFFSRAAHRQAEDPKSYQRWVGFRCVEDPPNLAVIGSTNLNPATLGVDVPVEQPQAEAVTNAQPTQPPPPEASRADDSGTSNSAG